MKVAHFAIYGPNASGMYESVKDLILAERQTGVDAQFIDYGFNDKTEVRVGLKDGHITTMPLRWADGADVVVCHSNVPTRLLKSKPSIQCLHGRPEGSFRTGAMGHTYQMYKKNLFDMYVTFWDEYLYYWSRILIGKSVFSVDPPIDFSVFKPSGDKYDFGKHNGSPNIVLVDMWRVSEIPFNLIFGAQYFKEHYAPDAKLHLFGLSSNQPSISILKSIDRLGLLGARTGVIRGVDKIYRAADIALTPHHVATRAVRESLATGVPIVAGEGCRFTPYSANTRNYKGFAKAIKHCFDAEHDPTKIRQSAKKLFSQETIGSKMKSIFIKAINRGGNA